MLTDRFNKLRKKQLTKIFTDQTICSVWRKIVKDQLRTLNIKDIYDYYDFNFNIELRAKNIRDEIINGNYKVSKPLIFRIEKKFGVCRHIIIPQPNDALIMQVIVETISDEILSNQPSKNSFFSRDKHNVKKIHDFEDYGLSWRKLWKHLQKKIYNFNESKEIVIVTDLSNYYDSIDIDELKKVFTNKITTKEVLIDLLFRIIEEISWKPDYLPYSGRGLPVSNLEAIRLLAHTFLFELDEVLKHKSNNNFTRWMDDIIIGADSKKNAIEILSSISDVLKSRGLSINLAKTDTYDSNQANYNFLIDSNKYLDQITNEHTNNRINAPQLAELNSKFKKHLKDSKPLYWSKVTKRFITAYGKLKSQYLIKHLPYLYLNYPDLRYNLLIYLSALGYSTSRSKVILEILGNLNLYDDISLFQITELVTKWEIPINKKSEEFLEKFKYYIFNFSLRRNTPFDYYCLIWFMSKYASPKILFGFINKNKHKWEPDSFLRRQVTATISRLIIFDQNESNKLLFSQISSGNLNTVSLANQIIQFSEIKKINKRISLYLFPEKKPLTYPLPKFLVLCSILNSEKTRTNNDLKKKINEYISDPYYLKWLKEQYNILYSSLK